MTLKYFYDLLSQPSRALYIFLKINKIPFEPCPVAIMEGEHLSDDFKQNYSRLQKLPFIHDGDFRLNENIAIVRYLSRLHREKIADHWYPEDPENQAKVDEYLEWQHHNTRATCALYFIENWAKPLFTGLPPNPKKVENRIRTMEKCFDQLEELWLGQGTKFIAGDTISYADILAACELEQPSVCGYDVTKGRPNMTKWFEAVKKETSPYYEEAHEVLRKMAKDTDKVQVRSKL